MSLFPSPDANGGQRVMLLCQEDGGVCGAASVSGHRGSLQSWMAGEQWLLSVPHLLPAVQSLPSPAEPTYHQGGESGPGRTRSLTLHPTPSLCLSTHPGCVESLAVSPVSERSHVFEFTPIYGTDFKMKER